jgi:hypothetical protein
MPSGKRGCREEATFTNARQEFRNFKAIGGNKLGLPDDKAWSDKGLVSSALELKAD